MTSSPKKVAGKSATQSTLVSLNIADLSAFCKSLRQQLLVNAETPSHLALMNMLARSAGYRNYQTLRAKPSRLTALSVTANPLSAKAIVLPRGLNLPKLIQRTITHFDTTGKLMRWPTQFSVQQLALWGLWSRLPSKRELTETEVNQYLNAYNAFGDPATLRRELVNAKFLWRTKDGRTYRKEPKTPTADEALFVKQLFVFAKS